MQMLAQTEPLNEEGDTVSGTTICKGVRRDRSQMKRDMTPRVHPSS
jgi:hypothetical protein